MSSLQSSYFSNYRRILSLGLPILVGQLGQVVVGFIDNSMVGHYHTDALAAASFVINVFNIAVLMAIGFSYGLTPLIGKLFAQRANDEIGATLRVGLRLNIIFALTLTAVMAIVYANLDRLGQPSDLLPLIRPYFLLYLAGIVPISIFQAFAQWSYAVNSSRMPMWIIIASNVINVVGNYALIFGNLGSPELGLTGAGISTLFARWFSAIAIIVVYLRGRRYRCYHSGFFHGRHQRQLPTTLLKTSLTISLQMGLETGAFSIAAVMAGWLGHIELASYQIVVTIGCLGYCIYYSISCAISVLVANAVGEGSTQKMRRVAFAGYHLILLLAVVDSLLFYFAGDLLISIFTDDRAVANLTSSVIIALIFYQLMDATQISFAGALRGAAVVTPMLLTALLAYIIVGIPATYILAFTLNLGLLGIVMSFSVSLLCAALMFFFIFMRSTRGNLPLNH
jgi:MATE family multidrug resistance protein